MGAGVLNLTNCVGGVPIIMSCPHFLFAADEYINGVSGVTPNIDDHRTLIFIEPLTGVPMKAHKRIQFNTMLFKDPRIDMTAKLPEILYPLFWVDENFQIDKKNADIFYDSVEIPMKVINYGKFAILGAGFVLLVICFIFSIYIWRKNAQEEEIGGGAINWNPNEQTPLITNQI